MINEEALKGVILDVKKKAIDDGYEIIWPTRGGSMFPLLRTNNRIVVVKCDTDRLMPGDIILYTSKDNKRIVAHRFIKKIRIDGKFMFLAKGDSAFNYDKPIAIDSIVGRVIKIKRQRFAISLNTSLGRFINIIILILSVTKIAPLGIYIFRRIKRIARHR